MSCHHHHKPKVKESKKIGLWRITSILSLVVATFFIEICIYWEGSSCIILSDALHNLSDAGAVLISIIAIVLSYKIPTKKYTYGFARLQDVAALINNSTTLISAVLIIYKSILCLQSGEGEAASNRILFIGILSLVCNGISYLMMSEGTGENTNLNIRSLNLHLLGDILGSLSTICAGIVVHLTGSIKIDPIISILLSIFIIRSAWYLFKETCKLFMNSVPESVDIVKVEEAILRNKNVISMHSLHIFEDGDNIHLTVHIVNKDMNTSKRTLIMLDHALKELNITHVSIQQEPIGYKCSSRILEEK